MTADNPHEKCDHGVSFTDLCEPCAHRPEEVWVGFPMQMCGFCQRAWPCTYARHHKEPWEDFSLDELERRLDIE